MPSAAPMVRRRADTRPGKMKKQYNQQQAASSGAKKRPFKTRRASLVSGLSSTMRGRPVDRVVKRVYSAKHDESSSDSARNAKTVLIRGKRDSFFSDFYFRLLAMSWWAFSLWTIVLYFGMVCMRVVAVLRLWLCRRRS